MSIRPISFVVDDWRLEVSILADGQMQIAIVTADKPASYHYVRVTAAQAEVLRDYLTLALKPP